MAISWAETSIKFLKGVGETRAKILNRELGITTFRDLLYYFPSKHIDRSRIYRISELTENMPSVQLRGHFIKFFNEGEGAKRRRIGVFSDGLSLMTIVWFARIKWIEESIKHNIEYLIFGKPNLFNGSYSIVHPEIEPFDIEKPPEGFRGIYSLTENMRKHNFSSKNISSFVNNLLPCINKIAETLPPALVENLHLMPLDEALTNIHRPHSNALLQRAQERLKFEELFYIQLHILRHSRGQKARLRGFVFNRIGNAFNNFYNKILPFSLTEAQKRVIREIHADMATGRQMNRLLQGDVGSGKTMVAFMSMLIAIDNGYQTCMIAPTEILAQQHFQSLLPWAEALGLKIQLLTGSIGVKDRRKIHKGLTDGSLHMLIGTHAVLEDTVQFSNIGMVIIDEQHRFGVAQRAKMWTKNSIAPHILVMTATPIPRTLAMTLYGDLDISVINELPPGRKPIQTLLRYENNRAQVYRALEHQIKAGRQAYIVYPLVHNNENLTLKSIEEGLTTVSQQFPNMTICCVHGQMKPAIKDEQMQKFITGEAQIMVATTVIEVGVNVPNASVMLIENAERFGLSQLHQLRGRVGRGADKSYCILMSKPQIAKETRQRLEIMTQTTDGFLIAEADMKMRGPGDIEGTMQSGLAFNLHIADLIHDGQILQRARDVVQNLLNNNPELLSENENNTEILKISVASDEGKIRINLTDIYLLTRELQLRSNRTVDWSRIS